MRAIRHLTKSTQTPFAILLVIVLLFSQWLGFFHAVAHAGWPHEPASSSFQAFDEDKDVGVDTSPHRHHSCISFDAATLTASIHRNAAALPMPGSRCIRLSGTALLFRDILEIVCPFSPRAPPI
jgi:hypothetical protein